MIKNKILKKYDIMKTKKKKYHKKKLERLKYLKNTIEINSSIINCRIFYFKFLGLILIMILILKFFRNNNNIINKNKLINIYNITSDKWIVMTAFNPPSDSIINLEQNIYNWKIIVIGNIKTIDSNWDIFNNSNKLIYLSIKEQNKLGYNILKFLPDDSYNRKNIGYLFAIQHGAKEIYEYDENLDISKDNLYFLDININNTYICYTMQNEQRMINPYIHFGETNIWPRGFLIKDFTIDYNKSIYYANSAQIKVKPLIYQGLINEIPDVDSLFLLSSGKMKENLNISFSSNFPLLYLPGNYVPINSKNTKYLYEIFPFLMLPVTVNKSIADILRGYIIERFAYGYEGSIIYFNSNVYNRNKDYNTQLFEEREILFHLHEILEIITSNNYLRKNPKNLLFHFLTELIKLNLLKEKEKEIFQAYLKDLHNVGYIFPTKFSPFISNNYKDYLDIKSEFINYVPTNQNILKGNNKFKIMKHSSSDIIYNNILLIINYNIPGYLRLSEYFFEIYKKYFPNIVFINPDNNSKDNANTINCQVSNNGFYSYACIEKIYQNFPNYDGYLLTNDDDYLKVWELENYDFDIPWNYRFNPDGLNKKWDMYQFCLNLTDICENNLEWKRNITNFYGEYKLFSGFSDLYYIPKYYISNFIEISKKMLDSKIFLECAIDTIFAIISAPKNQIIHIRALWGEEREKAISFLYEDFQQLSVHPLKFSKDEIKDAVRKYNYFINANEF